MGVICFIIVEMKFCVIFCVFLITVSVVSAGKLAGRFVRKSLDVQFDIADKVSKLLNSSIILFSADKSKFNNASVLSVDNYRYYRAATGEIGVLSLAAQEVFASTNTYLQNLGVRPRVKLSGQDVVLEEAERG